MEKDLRKAREEGSEHGRKVEERPARGRERQKSEREDVKVEAWGKGEVEKQEEKGEEKGEEKKGWSRRKKWVVGIIIGLVLVAGIIGGVVWWLHARKWEKTDDAFIDAHAEQAAAQVAGRVERVLVKDNQWVKAGEALLEIDPRDFNATLGQAEANLAQAQSRVGQAVAQKKADEAAVKQSQADVEAAKVTLGNAETELKRNESLPRGAVAAQTVDNLRAAARNAQAQLTAMEQKLGAAQAQVQLGDAAIKAAEAGVGVAKNQVEQANLNLSYTQVKASIDGRVTQRQVQAGDYVTAGQQLMVLVPRDVWVTANYKETQLEQMRVGQPVEISVDAFPGVKFHGHVDSFQKGSGAWFSLLPPENATGNYVKVVQRVPVKIVFDGQEPKEYAELGPGMSVVPKVRVRE